MRLALPRPAFRTLCALAIAVPAQPVLAQTYPTKAVRVIVGFAPGGPTDIIARLLAPRLSTYFGQSFVVENRAGGNTIIGTELVAKAPPDGYTVLLVASPFVVGPSLLASLPYDTLRDFDAVATLLGVLVLGVIPGIALAVVGFLLARR